MSLMFSNFKVVLRRPQARLGYDAIIYTQRGRTSAAVTKIDKDGALLEDFDEDGLAPILYLEPEIIAALAVALDELYKGKRGEYVEGELAATKTHLTDLRHLLKLPKNKS